MKRQKIRRETHEKIAFCRIAFEPSTFKRKKPKSNRKGSILTFVAEQVTGKTNHK